MLELDKRDIEVIANARWFRQNSRRVWGSFGAIVAVTLGIGIAMHPGPGWTVSSIAFVSVIATCAIGWTAWVIQGQTRAVKKLVMEWEDAKHREH